MRCRIFWIAKPAPITAACAVSSYRAIATIGLLLGLLLWASSAFADSRPVVTMFLVSPWRHAEDLWPIDLLLVAYDDGLIIKRADIANDNEGLRFVSQQSTTRDVMALAAIAKSHLQKIPAGFQARPGILDLPTTYIQYWDEDKSTLVEISNYGAPCMADPDQPTGLLFKMMRDAVHPEFLKLCDALLGLKLPGAQTWQPAEMLVTLLAQRSRPDESVAWPTTWPRKWRESADHRVRELCVPVDAKATDLATGLPPDPKTYWFRSVAVEETTLEWWVIVAKKVVMPGAIYAVDNPAEPMMPGPCSTIAD